MALGDDKVQIAVVMTKELKQELTTYAKAHHWSMSQAASLLIAEGINRWFKENSLGSTEPEKPQKPEK